MVRERFIIELRESIARGRNLWESPEWTWLRAEPCEERGKKREEEPGDQETKGPRG